MYRPKMDGLIQTMTISWLDSYPMLVRDSHMLGWNAIATLKFFSTYDIENPWRSTDIVDHVLRISWKFHSFL